MSLVLGRNGRPRALGLIAFAGVLVLAVLLLPRPAISAGVEEASCAYVEAGPAGPQGNVLEVNAGEYASIEIERVRDAIRVNEFGDYPVYHREVDCAGGQASIYNIDSIVLGLDASADDESEYFSDQTFSFDMQDGMFAPGATPEAGGGSEIELTTDGGPGLISDATIITSRGEDQIRSTTSEAATQINLNAGEATPDWDMVTPPLFFTTVYTGSGDDVVIDKSSLRFKKFKFPGLNLAYVTEKGNDTVKASAAFGEDGDDNLVGWGDTDFLIGGDGDDALRGKNGADYLVSAGGHDLMLGGHGNDVLLGLDGNGDRVHCEEGNKDAALVDPGDKRQGCEGVRVRRIRKGNDDNGVGFLPFKVRTRDRHGKPLL